MDKDLITKEETPIAKPVGLNQMDEFQPIEQDDTIRLPRLMLVQGGLNNQVIKDGLAKDGDLINSLSKENYGQSIEIIPIIQRKATRIRWQSRANGGGILCVSRDGEHGGGDPGDMLEGNLCSICPFFMKRKAKDNMDTDWCSYNYQLIALDRKSKEPLVLSADSVKPSDNGIRDMLGIARLAGAKGIRMWQKSYVISVKQAEANGYSFFKLTCTPGNNNQLLPKEEMEFFEAQFNFFRGAKIDADMEEHTKEPEDF